MDTFMDKLAQRLTAQEIIKANTAADTEEMNKLKNQIAEYNQCLVKLERLIEEGTEKIKSAQGNPETVNRLADECLAKIRAMQQDGEGLKQLEQKMALLLSEGMKESQDRLAKKVDETDGHFSEKLNQAQGQLSEMLEQTRGELSDKLDQTGNRLWDKLDTLGAHLNEKQEPSLLEGQLTDKLAALEENVHRECVKVYRNVQAVVVEEGSKQSEAVTGAASVVGRLNGKLNAVLGISIVALLASVAGMVVQILKMAGIL